MRRTRKTTVRGTEVNALAVTVKFESIQKRIARSAASRRKVASPGAKTAPEPAGTPVMAAAAAPAQNLDKDQRIAIMEADAAASAKIALEVEERTASPDPIEAARAGAVLIEARNTRDDLNENLAFLRGKDTFKAISAADIQHLDELADIIDARIKASALVNATLAILTETIHASATIGQILDERA